jgi:hypothetical protein
MRGLELAKPDEGLRIKYCKVVDESPLTTPFHTIEWLDLLTRWIPNSKLYFLIGDEDAFMPIIEKRVGPLIFYYSLPYGTFGGFIGLGDSKKISDWDKLILPKGGMTQVVDIWGTLDPSPLFRKEENICHIIELPGEYKTLFRKIYKKTQRETLRTAWRRGMWSKPMDNVDELRAFYQLYRKLYRKKGSKALEYEKVELAFKILKPTGLWRGYLAMHGEEIVGGIVSLYHPRMTVAYIMGIMEGRRELKIGNILMDAAIRDALESGSRLFNLGVTPRMNRGVVKYKESFGAKPVYFPVYTKTSVTYQILSRLRRIL